MTLTRRDMLRLVAGAAVASPILSACGEDGLFGSSTGSVLASKAGLPDPFGMPLPVPPVLTPVRTEAGTDYYEVVQRQGEAEMLPGLRTTLWGYNGIFPGPTIVSRSGRRVVVRHRNELPVPVSVHLHGGKTPPEHDGYPTDLVLPIRGWAGGHEHGAHAGHGGRLAQGIKDYVYPMDQTGATLWYHDHRMDFTGPQVYRGLAGFHLVHDDSELALPLPKGDRDIPLMICDRSFAEDGSFLYPSIDPTLTGRPGVTRGFIRGVLGDVILVNGVAWPRLEVTNTRYRFRILNASNARRYRLTLDPPPREGLSFTQVGSDTGLLGLPLMHSNIELAQAERLDVIVDFSRYPIGTQVTMKNDLGNGSTARVMRFDVVRPAKDDSSVPAKLADFEKLSRSSATVTRDFQFVQGGGDGSMWTVNGHMFDPARDDAQPHLGATEIWRLTTDVHHPVHLHLAHFQVLSRNGQGVGRQDAGWKDTIDLRRGETAEIVARFTGYRGRYVFHCHNLEHEDMAMMANMRII
jgi:FtsP/CotA-like multicopper oxidase with cupredoxin domain